MFLYEFFVQVTRISYVRDPFIEVVPHSRSWLVPTCWHVKIAGHLANKSMYGTMPIFQCNDLVVTFCIYHFLYFIFTIWIFFVPMVLQRFAQL